MILAEPFCHVSSESLIDIFNNNLYKKTDMFHYTYLGKSLSIRYYNSVYSFLDNFHNMYSDSS